MHARWNESSDGCEEFPFRLLIMQRRHLSAEYFTAWYGKRGMRFPILPWTWACTTRLDKSLRPVTASSGCCIMHRDC